MKRLQELLMISMDPENEGSLLDGITKGIVNSEKFI